MEFFILRDLYFRLRAQAREARVKAYDAFQAGNILEHDAMTFEASQKTEALLKLEPVLFEAKDKKGKRNDDS